MIFNKASADCRPVMSSGHIYMYLCICIHLYKEASSADTRP